MKFSFFRNVIVPIMLGVVFTVTIVGGIGLIDGFKKKQVEEVKIQRSKRIEEMAEAIILADKMREGKE